ATLRTGMNAPFEVCRQRARRRGAPSRAPPGDGRTKTRRPLYGNVLCRDAARLPNVTIEWRGVILDFIFGEPDANLVPSFFDIARGMHQIGHRDAALISVCPAHVGEVAANSTRRSLVGISRANDLAGDRDRLDALQYQRDDRATFHERCHCIEHFRAEAL